jgi:hypothetical protein
MVEQRQKQQHQQQPLGPKANYYINFDPKLDIVTAGPNHHVKEHLLTDN